MSLRIRTCLQAAAVRGVLGELRLLAPVSFLVAIFVGLATLAAPAGAALTHPYVSRLTGPSLGEPFGVPWGLAFDAQGNLYVADASGRAVDVFDSAGVFSPPRLLSSAFREPFTRSVAVSDATGDVYVAESGPEDVDVFKPEGAGQYKLLEERHFGGYVYVAVDNSASVSDARRGDVYVFTENTVQAIKPNAEGELQEAGVEVPPPPGGFATGPNGEGDLAVDSATGALYAANSSGGGAVDVYNDKGELESELTGGGTPAGSFDPVGVGIEESTGDVYVVDAAHGVVDELSETGAYLRQIKQTTAGESLAEPLAVAVSSSSEVYVSDGAAKVVDVFGVDVVVPDVTTGAASGVVATTATVAGTVNPDAITVTTCQFEYGTSTSYGQTAPCSPAPGSGGSPVAVTATLSVQSGSTYHYRLSAANANGVETGKDETFTTPAPPTLIEQSASSVAATSATLNAQINARGADTHYYFEYGSISCTTSPSSCTSIPTAPGADIGAEETPQSASVYLQGLLPGATYHYRLIATNAVGTSEGPDETFTTQSAGATSGLSDGRQWELVSPPDKLGAALDGIGAFGGTQIQAAADGSAITYESQGPIGADPEGNRDIARISILSSRTASGWSSMQIATPHETAAGGVYNYSEYRAFSPDLSVGLVEPEGSTPLSPQASERTSYLRQANGEYTPLVTPANVPAGLEFGFERYGQGGVENPGVEVVDATPDLSRLVVSSTLPLVEGITYTEGSTNSNLFEWADGSLRLVSVLPDGKAASEEGESATVGFGISKASNARNAVSDDGSRVFWEASRSGGSSLYMRDLSRGETVQLDTAQAGAQGGSVHPEFLIASSDGSRVFFKDEGRLTANASPEGADLYMCKIGEVAGKLACRLKDLTADPNAGESADVQGTALGASEDGRYLYFVASGALAAGATPGNCRGEAHVQLCNLYVYDTATNETKLIAQLANGGGNSDANDWQVGYGSDLFRLTAGVSPDGRYLAFMSARSLTGYDNIDARSGQPDVEVYLYDAGTGKLTCPSCNPSGGRPTGIFDSGELPGSLVDLARSWAGQWLAGSIPGWTNAGAEQAFYRSRYLSDSGRLFFDSADALVPRDANGTEDVYEYAPSGIGGCTAASATFSERPDGCVNMISSGTSGEESAFLDASESGNDVFFLTAAQLAPQDLDGALDVYDAHVCSAAAPCLAAAPAQSPPCATADACRAAPAQQPGVFGAPPSATFAGAGNLAPAASRPATTKKQVSSVARKRAAALRRCRAKPKRRRPACEARARRLYRVVVKAKRSVRSPIRKGNR